MQLGELATRVVPLLVFLVSVTVLAELSALIGVFATLARAAARLAGGSVLLLWLLVVVVAVVCTAVLSLDTTAVLLTPVVLSMAAQLGLDRGLFAYTVVWLANTASLFLPVSNLTNLLAVHTLARAGQGGSALEFAGLLWPAAVASVLVTVAGLVLCFQRSLRGRYAQPPREPVPDRPLLWLATAVCAALGPALLAGVDVTTATSAAALLLALGCLVRAPRLLSTRLLPWPLVVGVTVLFLLVQVAHEHGLDDLVRIAAGTGETWPALARLTGIGAVAANLINNLPGYLALEPAAAGSPIRLAVLLLGVGSGSLVVPWASLATLLWAGRCRSVGVPVRWGRFALRGALLVPPLLVVAVTAQWLVHG